MAELIGQLGDTQSQRRGRERRHGLDVLSQRSRLYELSANSVVTYCELGGSVDLVRPIASPQIMAVGEEKIARCRREQ